MQFSSSLIQMSQLSLLSWKRKKWLRKIFPPLFVSKESLKFKFKFKLLIVYFGFFREVSCNVRAGKTRKWNDEDSAHLLLRPPGRCRSRWSSSRSRAWEGRHGGPRSECGAPCKADEETEPKSRGLPSVGPVWSCTHLTHWTRSALPRRSKRKRGFIISDRHSVSFWLQIQRIKGQDGGRGSFLCNISRKRTSWWTQQ